MPRLSTSNVSSIPSDSSAFKDEFFNEPRRNLYTLILGLVILLAAIATIIVIATRSHALMTVAPIAIIMAIWALIFANHINSRRRCSPVVRLEKTRLRYFGGSLFMPRLIDVNYADVDYLESGSSRINVCLRMKKGKKRRHVIPIGMLPRDDRRRFIELLMQRVPTRQEARKAKAQA